MAVVAIRCRGSHCRYRYHRQGITVHRVDCQNLEKFSAMPELWLDIEWERDTPGSVAARRSGAVQRTRQSRLCRDADQPV